MRLKLKWKLNENTIFVLLFALSPMVDVLNGFLLRTHLASSLSLGKIYRMAMILVLTGLWTVKMNRRYFRLFFVGAFYVGFSILLHLLLKTGSANLTDSLVDGAYVLLPPLIFFVFQSVRPRLSGDVLGRILRIWSWFVPLSLVLPYFADVGYSTYARAGYKGFYFANNAVSYIAVICFISVMYQALCNFSAVKCLQLILCGASLLLLGTKSCWFLAFVGILLCFWMRSRTNLSHMLKWLLPWTAAIALGFLLLVNLFSGEISQIIDRAQYNRTIRYSGNWAAYLTTGRVLRIPLYIRDINGSNTLVRWLFGSGNMTARYSSCEMDFFDVLFMFGITGLLLLAGFLLYVYRRRRRGRDNLFTILFLLSLVYAFLVGHIFTNALSAGVFGIICCGMTEKPALQRSRAERESPREELPWKELPRTAKTAAPGGVEQGYV